MVKMYLVRNKSPDGQQNILTRLGSDLNVVATAWVGTSLKMIQGGRAHVVRNPSQDIKATIYPTKFNMGHKLQHSIGLPF